MNDLGKMGKKRRVVITGLGLVTSLGLDVEENWESLLAGRSGIRRFTGAQNSRSPIRAAGEVRQSDWSRICKRFAKDSANQGERRTLFGLWAAGSALSDAGILDFRGDRERYGVVSSAGAGICRLEDIAAWIDGSGQFDLVGFGKEYPAAHGESLIKNGSNRQGALISERFSLYGPNSTVSSACASATQAVGLGYRAISRGRADLMVSGGADSTLFPLGIAAFVLIIAPSVFAGDPALACRPFDRKRSGLVIGEGGGFVVLEELSHALERGGKIYAEIAGYGSSMDAFRMTAPDPQGRGATLSMGNALKDAQLGISDIDYINAHGTGTRQNDISETIAIKRLFKEHASRLSISSSKSMIGHLLAAAGGPEFIYTVLSIRDNKIHPTINLLNPDPKCDLDYVPNIRRSRPVRAALSNSFGMGGQNATIVVKKFA